MTAEEPTRRRRVFWAGLVIALAGFAAYANGLRGPFVFDDPSSITANPTIRHLWPPWAPLATPKTSVTVQGRPVLNLSLAINHAISGDEVWSYHALNVLIHILAGLTLFGITRRTLQNAARGRRSPLGGEGGPAVASRTAPSPTLFAFAVALLWTLHPLQTEAVTYTIQRAESLMGLFYLLTLYCFVRYVEADEETKAWRLPLPDHSGTACPPKPGEGGRQRFVGPAIWAALSVLACLAGMATKEVMVSAPVIVFLYDRTFVAGSFREAWRRRRSVHLGLASTWILLGYLVMSGGGDRNGTIGFGVDAGWWAYGLTQFPAIVHYLRMVVWPHPLVFEYGTFWVKHPAQVIPDACIVVPLVAATVVALFRWPVWGFLGFWFFAILAPTSLVPGTTQMIVEHRMYLALAPVLVAIACMGSMLVRPAVVWLGILTVLAGICGVLTALRNEDYRTEVILWTDTVTKRPGNALARTMFGQALDRAGLTREALEQFEVSVRFDPLFAMSQENLGEVLFKLGRWAEAKARYQEALRLKPDYADAHDNLGVALAREGRSAEAMAQIRQAIAIKSDYPEAYYNLAGILAATGHGPEAVAQYEAALRAKPDYPAAHYNLANTLEDLGRGEEAVAHYESALRQKPDYPDAQYNLGNALAQLHRPAEAIRHYAEALRQRPNYPEAQCNWGSALFDSGHLDEAKAHYEAALRLDPNFSEARENLARLRAYRRERGLPN